MTQQIAPLTPKSTSFINDTAVIVPYRKTFRIDFVLCLPFPFLCAGRLVAYSSA